MILIHAIYFMVWLIHSASAMPRPVTSDWECPDHLFNTATPIELHVMKESVQLPERFYPHPSGMTLASGHVFTLQEREHSLVKLGEQETKIDEVVNQFTLLSTSTGQRLTSEKQLLERINNHLVKYATQLAVDIEGNSALIFDGLDLAVFRVRLSDGSAMVFGLNVQTQELRWLSTMSANAPHFPRLRSFHNRFLAMTAPNDLVDDYYTTQLLDLVTGDRLLLEHPARQDLNLSADGQKLLLMAESGSSTDDSTNVIYRLSGKWSLRPHEILNRLDLEEIAAVPYTVVTSNSDFTRLLINQNPRAKVPDLSIAEIDPVKGGVRIVQLELWKNVMENLRAETQKGLRYSWQDLNAEFSPRGDDLMINLEMNWFKGDRDPLSRPLPHRSENWVIVWPFSGKNGGKPWQFKSKDMNVVNDTEVHSFIHRMDAPILWPRQFSSRFLPDGRIIMVRAVAHELARAARLSRVMVKARVVDFDSDKRTDYNYTLNPVKLDPSGGNGSHAGIPTLQIAPNGRSLLLHITGHGIVVLNLNGHSRDYAY